MVTLLETPKQLSEMIIDDYPSPRDGLLRLDMYAYGLKNEQLNKKHYVNLCLECIPQTLTLFPMYPNAIELIRWIKQSEIFNDEIGLCLINLVENIWTEESCPERIGERSLIILNMIDRVKHLITFEKVKAISPKTCMEKPWWVNRVLYEYDPEKSLDNLSEMPTSGFAKIVMLYIPTYLETFSVEDLRKKFEILKLPSVERRILFKWLDIFSQSK